MKDITDNDRIGFLLDHPETKETAEWAGKILQRSQSLHVSNEEVTRKWIDIVLMNHGTWDRNKIDEEISTTNLKPND